MEISGSILGYEGKPANMAMIRDITERKKMEMELQKSDILNKAILDALPDMIFQFNKDGTIIDYRPSANINTYVQPDEFLGKKISEILPKELVDRISYSTEQLMQTKKLQRFDYQLLMDGNLTDFEARLVLSGNDSILGIISDITERKLAQK